MTALDFRKVDVLKAQPFEAGSLPDAEKERLCRDLLAEFGVTSIRVSDTGEMIHSCCLPYGAHKNGDAAASASLNYQKLAYNCLGCGSSGGLLWFIATCRGEDTNSARRWLEDQTGAGPDEQSLASLLSFFDSVYGAKEDQRPAPVPKMSESVLTPWLKIHPYMTEVRGVSPESLMRHKVGYSPDYRTRVGEEFIPSQRIVIPHFWKGDLVGWQTRRLVNDGTPKYVSSPDFPKDTTIYNYDAKAKSAEVVESPMSVLVCADDEVHQEATFGAKVTERQIRLLTMHPRVVLWMDNDEAGWKATKHLGEALEPYSDVWVIDNPWNADPADLTPAERTRLRADPTPFGLWRPPKVIQEWHG
jgi:hypothetical protein